MKTNKNTVLILSAHPDDAEICLGGTIALLTKRQVSVTVVNFTTSEKSPDKIKKRQEAAYYAASILGYNLLWAEEGRFNQVEDIPQYRLVGIIDEYIKLISPEILFSHWTEDSHEDHVRLARATISATRSWDGDFYMYGPSEIRTIQFAKFTPNVYVDISSTIEDKTQSVLQYNYSGQNHKELNKEAIKYSAKHYGIQSNLNYAEAFLLVRKKIRNINNLLLQSNHENL